MDDFVPPPPRPPPLLPPASLHHLCAHGYIGLNLPHPLAQQYEQLLAASDAFFAQPLAAKLPYRPANDKPPGHLGPPSSPTNTERGYTHLDGEKEYLTLRKSMTHLPPGIYDAAAPVWHDTAHLLHRILGDIGVYLGLGPTAWDGVVADSLEPGDGVYYSDAVIAAAEAEHSDGKGEGEGKGKGNVDEDGDDEPVGDSPPKRHHPRDDPPTLLRLFRYEPGGGGAEQHRDLGLLTICVCWGKGLQVKPQPPGPLTPPQSAEDGGPTLAPPSAPPPAPDWVDAPQVTVMTGDTLRVLSSNRIPSAIHRVVVDPKEAAAAAEARIGGSTVDTPPSESRRSIVFALRATTVGDIALSDFGGFGSIGARELYDNIRKSRVNINADKDRRALMRAEYQRAKGIKADKREENENENETTTDGDRAFTQDKGESMDGDTTIEGEITGVA
ncbi:uncharacterized protein SPSK_07562 [Sporothrix schenckii 1099-18]|uniref:Fe2OG dioxygenase domain-containing protein n=1 Tax=Sporothrix schenckii 1099-18 TaxID=1397361 RepID=A0A0F2MFQ9_SPOSC|nr:uncharacterized protein SPSK_07562 [Sporothrix schenckii 1099-18]KJR87690.1 hypothetical protein SPSK_07562 [Sporothrix schenckii 1099-18]